MAQLEFNPPTGESISSSELRGICTSVTTKLTKLTHREAGALLLYGYIQSMGV